MGQTTVGEIRVRDNRWPRRGNIDGLGTQADNIPHNARGANAQGYPANSQA